MTTLRNEYKKYKQQKSTSIQEAAISWVMENVVLLDENFNRDSLQRLQTSITKFDKIFAPHAAKVPAVKCSLDDAVEILNRITMGEKITKKDGRLKLSEEEEASLQDPATYMVKYMSLLYNNLSRFFNKDMIVLVQLPIFRLARENPTIPLKDLADANRMRAAILNAIAPNAEMNNILRRMYRAMDLPNLDYQTIADEMLNLTINDFEEMTKVDKVPLVVSPPATDAPKMDAPEMEAATCTNPKVQGGDDVLTEEEEALLKEIGEVNPEQLKQVADGIKRIQEIVAALPELEDLSQALNQLMSQALAATGGTANLTAPGMKQIAATANTVYDYFQTLAKLAPQIEQLVPQNREPTEADLKAIEGILKKSQGGVMNKISNWWKGVRVDPRLTPTSIAAGIMAVNRSNPGAAGQSLRNFFGKLQSMNLPVINPAAATPAAGSTQSQGTAGSVPSAQAGTTSGAQAPGQAQQTASNTQQPQAQQNQTLRGTGPATGAQQVSPEVVKQMAKDMGLPENDPNVAAQVNALVQKGWKITPPSGA
jgi:hypothetical protein